MVSMLNVDHGAQSHRRRSTHRSTVSQAAVSHFPPCVERDWRAQPRSFESAIFCTQREASTKDASTRCEIIVSPGWLNKLAVLTTWRDVVNAT